MFCGVLPPAVVVGTAVVRTAAVQEVDDGQVVVLDGYCWSRIGYQKLPGFQRKILPAAKKIYTLLNTEHTERTKTALNQSINLLV